MKYENYIKQLTRKIMNIDLSIMESYYLQKMLFRIYTHDYSQMELTVTILCITSLWANDHIDCFGDSLSVPRHPTPSLNIVTHLEQGFCGDSVFFSSKVERLDVGHSDEGHLGL